MIALGAPASILVWDDVREYCPPCGIEFYNLANLGGIIRGNIIPHLNKQVGFLGEVANIEGDKCLCNRRRLSGTTESLDDNVASEAAEYGFCPFSCVAREYTIVYKGIKCLKAFRRKYPRHCDEIVNIHYCECAFPSHGRSP